MKTETMPRCELGLTSQDLSTWRAQGLNARASQRIEAHVSGCAACQAHLAAYDVTDAALRLQQIPTSNVENWQNLSSHLTIRHSSMTVKLRQKPVWGTLVSIAAVLLIMMGFIGLFSHATPGHPTASLSWQPGLVPSAVTDGYAQSSWHPLPLALSDGKTLYGCVILTTEHGTPAKTGSAVQIWATHDRATHWNPVSILPQTHPGINQCYLTVDALNPAILIAVASWDQLVALPNPTETMRFASFDGGGSWRLLTDQRSAGIVQLATYHGTTYAAMGGLSPIGKRLMASADQLRTWYPIDQAMLASGQQVQDFTVDPTTGTLLAETGQDGMPTRQLWASQDGGHTWARLAAPTAEHFVVGVSTSDQPATICASHYDVTQVRRAPNMVFCSDDDGQHWSQRPGLNPPAKVPLPFASGNPVGIYPIQLIAIASDGALVAEDSGPATPVLYRLPVGASQWQVLSPLPKAAHMVVLYSSHPGSGLLWAIDASAEPVRSDQIAFTAAYP